MMNAKSNVLESVFQPYYSAVEQSRRGELFSRRADDGSAEEFFDAISLEEHFRLLEFQLQVQHALYSSGGWHVSINVHNKMLSAADCRGRFLALIADAPGSITLEFTETYPMPPVKESNHLLRSIRDLGHSSALDDFGTGLNGMSLLTDYDFDIIKLDRSLVVDLPERIEKRKSIGLVQEMLAVLGKDHVVEGVETEAVYTTLLDLGFTTFQGYLFSEPKNVSEFGVEVTAVKS